jgi:hypothetical protein
VVRSRAGQPGRSASVAQPEPAAKFRMGQFVKRDTLLPALEQEARVRLSVACGPIRRRCRRGCGGRRRGCVSACRAAALPDSLSR